MVTVCPCSRMATTADEVPAAARRFSAFKAVTVQVSTSMGTTCAGFTSGCILLGACTVWVVKEQARASSGRNGMIFFMVCNFFSFRGWLLSDSCRLFSEAASRAFKITFINSNKDTHYVFQQILNEIKAKNYVQHV